MKPNFIPVEEVMEQRAQDAQALQVIKERALCTEQREPLPIEQTEQQEVHRLTLVLTGAVEQHCENPVSFDIRFSVPIQSKEDAYVRRYKLKTQWSFLNLGWLKDEKIRYVVLENLLPGTNLKVYDPKNTNDIQVSLNGVDYWDIPPGLVFMACPHDAKKIQVRSVEDNGVLFVKIIPA